MRNISSIPTTGLIVAVLLFAAVLFAGFMLYPDRVAGPVPDDAENTEASAYFTERAEARVVAQIGQPIEGFRPDMFLSVYPGLVPSDFDGIDAAQGYYRYTDGELVFVEDRGDEPPHSAAEMITRPGMAALLQHASARLDMPADTPEEVDALLMALAEESSVPDGETSEDVTVSGTITAIDEREVMVDGPYVVTIETEADATAVITVPSMGIQVCAAVENIANISDLEVGQTVEARGTLGDNDRITPCTSSEHYLRVIE